MNLRLRMAALCAVVIGVFATQAQGGTPPAAVAGVYTGASASVQQGIASAALAMPVPPGREGVQPSLGLTHASGGGLGDAGYGWMLGGTATIERAPRWGRPTYRDPPAGAPMTVSEDSKVRCTGPRGDMDCVETTPDVVGNLYDRFTLGGEALIPICTAGVGQCAEGSELPAWAEAEQWRYFRLQHDTYAKIFWSSDGWTWRVIDKNGWTIELGTPLVAKALWTEGHDVDAATWKPYRWLQTRSFDAVRDGAGKPVNVVAYRWEHLHDRFGHANTTRNYLTEIFYTPRATAGGIDDEAGYAHHVVLAWDPLYRNVPAKDEPSSVARATLLALRPAESIARQQTTQRLASVAMATREGTGSEPRKQVRTFLLGYTFKGGSRPYLNTFQMVGACRTEEWPKPRVEVDATGADRKDVQWPGQCGASPGTPRTQTTLTYTDAVLMPTWRTLSASLAAPARVTAFDVTGDGKADLVEPASIAQASASKQPLHINVGDRFVASEITAPTPILAVKILSPTAASSVLGNWSPYGNGAVFVQRPMAGNVNLVSKSEPIVTPMRTRQGGWAWHELRLWPYAGDFDQLGDINGDGYVDRRIHWANRRPENTAGGSTDPTNDPIACEAEVFFATEDGPTRGGDACAAAYTTPDRRYSVSWAATHGKPLRSYLADMDGDGLADLVGVWSSGLRGGGWPHGTEPVANDRGWHLPQGHLLTVNLGDGRGGFPQLLPLTGDLPSDAAILAAGEHRLHLSDMTGDGLSDLLLELSTGPEFYVNEGGGQFRKLDVGEWPTLRSLVGFSAALALGDAQTGSVQADMDGNGAADYVLPDEGQVHVMEVRSLGLAEGLLLSIDNGQGAGHGFTYASLAQLDERATAAGKPWATHSPRAAYVATSSLTAVSGSSRTRRKHTTTYTYRDPAWDGRRHRLRGFTTVLVAAQGDAEEPTTIQETGYHFSQCHKSPLDQDVVVNCPTRMLDNDPDDVLGGWPVWQHVRDERGVLLLVTTYRNVVATGGALKGVDGRQARAGFVAETRSYLHDVNADQSQHIIEDVKSGATLPDRGVPETKTPVDVGPKNGRVIVRSRVTDYDERTGNVRATSDDGRVLVDEAGDVVKTLDDPIIKQTEWAQVSPESRWLFRAKRTKVNAFAARTGVPRGEERVVDAVFDAFGRPTDSYGELRGTLPLDCNEEPASLRRLPMPALAPVGASQDGRVLLEHVEYADPWGKIVTVTGPYGACAMTVREDAYADHVVASTAFAGGCGQGALTSRVLGYDRGFGVATSVADPTAAVSGVVLDGLGRVTKTFAPDALAVGAPTLAAEIDYQPGPFGGWTIQRVSELGGGKKHETWTYLDGLGTAVLSLTQGDAIGTWTVSGLPRRTVRGTIVERPEPWVYTGEPKAHTLEPDPGAKTIKARLDVFGRVVETFGLDGQSNGKVTLRPLVTESQDAEALPGRPHEGRKATVYENGHGRVIRSIAWGKDARGTPMRIETHSTYQATGELARIVRTNGAERVVRWMQHDSFGRMVLNAEPHTSAGFVEEPTAAAAMRAWRYAYDDRGLLVGTSDARGCGKNLHYDAAGRPVAEDYWPCLATQEPYTAPDLTTGAGTEVFNVYDGVGRLESSSDRGVSIVPTYDARSRVVATTKKIARPGAVEVDLAQRYAPHAFTATADFDFVDRVVRQSSGAEVTELLGSDPVTHQPASAIAYRYSRRGLVEHVTTSYGTLLKAASVDLDGFVRSSTYGDVDDGDALETVATRTPTARRQLETYTLARTAPAGWVEAAPPATTRQLTLAAWSFGYDATGEVTTVHDGRDAREWPSGAKPVHRGYTYDDFHRLTRVDYDSGQDPQVATFAPELAGPRAASFMPPSTSGTRVQNQTFSYDWKGNTTRTGSDNPGAFYERSLGIITNGEAVGKPNQLLGALVPNAPRLSIGWGGTGGGVITKPPSNVVEAAYDDAGNMTLLRVTRATCADASRCNHVFAYEWNEVGELAKARRWDGATAAALAGDSYKTQTAAVDFRYTYGAGGRVLKSSRVGQDVHYTVDVFATLRLKDATWDPASGDYERSSRTEHVYLGNAHVMMKEGATGPPRVLLSLGDELGSTSVVIDKKSGELVERVTYQAYGGPESDYRPDGSFREDVRFTGKEDDAEVGLTYFGARYYASALNRWVSADPLTVHAAGADLNPYAYVGGSPTNTIDPVGLDGFCIGCIGTEGGGVGTGSNAPEITVVLGGGNGGSGGGSNLSGSGSGGGGSPLNNGTVGDLFGCKTSACVDGKIAELRAAATQAAQNQWLAGSSTFQTPANGVSGGGASWDPRGSGFRGAINRFVLNGNSFAHGFLQDDSKLQMAQNGAAAIALAAGAVATGGMALEAAGGLEAAVAAFQVKAFGAAGAITQFGLAEQGITIGGGGALAMAAHEAEPTATRILATEATAIEKAAVQTVAPATNAVYRSVTAAGDLQYVGITNNLARRAAEHLAGKGIQIEKLMGGLSRPDARAVEQALIESVAASNPQYAGMLRRGYDLLTSVGYQ